MTLQDKALNLVNVLRDIVRYLEEYGIDYTSRLANTLHPQVEELFIAINEKRSRPRAQEILTGIAPVMHEVNGAATKGEMNIFPDNTLLDRYWDLSTIFQESRYTNETL
ncbi:hypothetical protein ACFLQL_01865 [Verrucomicrobiota bacterium]